MGEISATPKQATSSKTFKLCFHHFTQKQCQIGYLIQHSLEYVAKGFSKSVFGNSTKSLAPISTDSEDPSRVTLAFPSSRQQASLVSNVNGNLHGGQLHLLTQNAAEIYIKNGQNGNCNCGKELQLLMNKLQKTKFLYNRNKSRTSTLTCKHHYLLHFLSKY